MRYKSGLDIALSESAVISMVTVYPGDEVYSLFGHSSFRVYDPENRIDWMYNYGTFDFSDPLFVPKFVAGRLDYYLDINSFQRSLKFYAGYEKRKVVEQVLSLDRVQRQALFDFLQDNGEPENRFYRYDFIWDNCSTRIELALEKTFPGGIDYSAYKPSGESFRQMIRQYLNGYPFFDFGIQLVLGRKADRNPMGKEVFFLPVPMMEAFSTAVFNEGGTPLVSEENVLAQSGRVYVEKGDYPLAVFLSVLAVYAAAAAVLLRRQGRGKAAAALILLCEGFVLLSSGAAGVVISYLWFFSDHTITVSNINILWCSPLNLALFAVLVRDALRRKGDGVANMEKGYADGCSEAGSKGEAERGSSLCGRQGSVKESSFCSFSGSSLTRKLWLASAFLSFSYLLLAASGVQAFLPAFLPPLAILLAAALRRAAAA